MKPFVFLEIALKCSACLHMKNVFGETMMKIACCIHDAKVASELQEALIAEGFDCEEFLSEISLLRTMKKRNFDLILMDEGLGAEQDAGELPSFYFLGSALTPVIVVSVTDVVAGVASILSLRLQHQG